jgi:hypothetical protein
MRPCTAGQKRFSLRISQMAQLKTQTPLESLCHSKPDAASATTNAKGSSGEFLLSDQQGGGAKRAIWEPQLAKKRMKRPSCASYVAWTRVKWVFSTGLLM